MTDKSLPDRISMIALAGGMSASAVGAYVFAEWFFKRVMKGMSR